MSWQHPWRLGYAIVLFDTCFVGRGLRIRIGANHELRSPRQFAGAYRSWVFENRGARNTYTAADLYQSIKACVKQDDLESAIYSSILANVYGRYDSMRVSDPSAHQAPAALRMQLQISLTEEQKKLFNTQVSATWNDPAKRVKICGRIREVGPPNYHPTYMIQHGMSAFTGSKGNGLVADFDSAAAWEKVLETSLHCPTP